MAAGPNRIGWDSNHFEFGEVKASKASGFTLLRCDPSVCYTGSPLPKINLFVTKALQPLGPDSKLVDGNLIDCELQLKLTAPLVPSQTALQPVSCQFGMLDGVLRLAVLVCLPMSSGRQTGALSAFGLSGSPGWSLLAGKLALTLEPVE